LKRIAGVIWKLVTPVLANTGEGLSSWRIREKESQGRKAKRSVVRDKMKSGGGVRHIA